MITDSHMFVLDVEATENSYSNVCNIGINSILVKAILRQADKPTANSDIYLGQ